MRLPAVIPAKAGIQLSRSIRCGACLDPRLRGDDGRLKRWNRAAAIQRPSPSPKSISADREIPRHVHENS
ncbi:hypothetical protein FZ938_04090 [Azospirillum oryzae]|nr:hypothetical protein FZ938_04090 [Azospirillum oryzae]